MYDIVIQNGKIIDGTGNSWFKANLGISSGKIKKISKLQINDSDRIINAKGLIVSPGFINLHSHSDSSILQHNRAENSLAMGLVTEVTGNCGISAAPITVKHRDFLREKLKETLGKPLNSVKKDLQIDWLSLSDWISTLEKRGIGINIAPCIGHGTIRNCVMGENEADGERVVPSNEELTEMKNMIDKAMKDGAFGLTTGLAYEPGINALTEEIVSLCEIVKKHGGFYASHIRSEEELLLNAIWEFIYICEKSGVRGLISHVKAANRNNYGKVCEVVRLVDKARARGLDIIMDQYPWRYGGGDKSLGAMFKPEIKTRKDLLENLKSQKKWSKLKDEYLERRKKQNERYEERKRLIEEKGGWVAKPFYLYPGGTIIHSKKHPEFNGKSFKEVADTIGGGDELEGIRVLLLEDEGYTLANPYEEPYSEEDIILVMKHSMTAISTDASVMDNTKLTIDQCREDLSVQHPRGWGTYPKILGKYVREEKILTISDAIRKMTSLPAQFLGLKDRGLIKEGFWADIVIFDPKTIDNIATYENPYQHPKGIPYVIVNGKIAIDMGKRTETLSGKVLKNAHTYE